jgi:hypothetical protein
MIRTCSENGRGETTKKKSDEMEPTRKTKTRYTRSYLGGRDMRTDGGKRDNWKKTGMTETTGGRR